MFKNNIEMLNLTGLEDFIEKPCQECSDQELENGVNQVVFVLNKNPEAVMDILKHHPFIAATYLLEDLVDKMKKQNCLTQLNVLFDRCLDDVTEACIYNIHDLDRCIEAMPHYTKVIMTNILSNEAHVKRIIESDEDPENTLNQIEEKYPQYHDEFLSQYNQPVNFRKY